jgi:hypothetical protein
MGRIWILTLILSGCKSVGLKTSEDQVYTLYRNSPIDKNMRIHMATFDADEKEAYNKENCEIGRDLFMDQAGVTAQYWCEKGGFKK